MDSHGGNRICSSNRHLHSPRSVTLFGFYSVAGGVPIVVDNQLIGSVGVSGTDGHDEACAVAGLEAAFGDRATVPVF